MRLGCVQLLVVLGLSFLTSSNAAWATSQEVKSLDAPVRGVPLTGSRTEHLRRRLLKVDSEFADEEERMGVNEALGRISNAVKMKTKMKFWLYRGTTPEKVLEKLKVTSTTDKNYKYYSKYFFKYYVKFPGRQPSNLPAKTGGDIMKARMHDWLENNLTPPQVFKKLGFTGAFSSARGHPNYKYFEQYSKMWSDLQVQLSKAKNAA